MNLLIRLIKAGQAIWITSSPSKPVAATYTRPRAPVRRQLMPLKTGMKISIILMTNSLQLTKVIEPQAISRCAPVLARVPIALLEGKQPQRHITPIQDLKNFKYLQLLRLKKDCKICQWVALASVITPNLASKIFSRDLRLKASVVGAKNTEQGVRYQMK